MDHLNTIMHRAKNLQEFEIQQTIPDTFRFRGPVPYDMEILGDQMFIKVWAISLDEAVRKVKEYLDRCSDEEY